MVVHGLLLLTLRYYIVQIYLDFDRFLVALLSYFFLQFSLFLQYLLESRVIFQLAYLALRFLLLRLRFLLLLQSPLHRMHLVLERILLQFPQAFHTLSHFLQLLLRDQVDVLHA